MNNITICIPSYKRPAMLRRLIQSIAGCSLNKSLIGDVNIIVGDNDAFMTAESTVNELKEKFNNTIKIDYYCFPVKGLSNVRNELLKKAIAVNPGFIVFIDDDEYASPDWLNELVRIILRNNGDMAIGPVISVFEYNVSEYISCWFQRRFYPDNKDIKFAATNNLIIKTDSLLKHNIWFDNRFNKTGGEDSYFGVQMIKKGATIFWASDAIVYETVPENRANIRWLIKRYYNGANIYMNILRIEKQYKKILKKFLVSLYYLVAGICATVIILLPFSVKYWGVLKFSEGMGGITGFFRIKYHEYK